MSILAWIGVGILAGWLAEKITGSDHGLITNLIVGVIGAFVGGFLMSALFGYRLDQGFNIATILVATRRGGASPDRRPDPRPPPKLLNPLARCRMAVLPQAPPRGFARGGKTS
jgi:uncharacterized membrane protein YeaQ/YmgE (transglycosylase-associated protein family)